MAESNEAHDAREKGEGRAEGEARPKKLRGFAAMDPDKQRAISRKGGESVPVEKRSFSQDRELAAQAGRKGGAARGGRGGGNNSSEGAGDDDDR